MKYLEKFVAWLENRLITPFFDWLESLGQASEEYHASPPHVYPEPYTLPYSFGEDRCMRCDTFDEERRPYNDVPCTGRISLTDLN